MIGSCLCSLVVRLNGCRAGCNGAGIALLLWIYVCVFWWELWGPKTKFHQKAALRGDAVFNYTG